MEGGGEKHLRVGMRVQFAFERGRGVLLSQPTMSSTVLKTSQQIFIGSLTMHEIKMAGYWPSVLGVFMLDRKSLVNRGRVVTKF